jgi:hypothetical protein
MNGLEKKKCVPCEGGVPPYTEAQAKAQLAQLKGWIIEDGERRKVLLVEVVGFALRAHAMILRTERPSVHAAAPLIANMATGRNPGCRRNASTA